MKFLILLLLLVVHQLYAEETEELKSRLNKVVDAGRGSSIKDHSEPIDSDLFINEHVISRLPSKLTKNAEKLISLFDNWNEKLFTPDPVYALLMGSLTWKYKENHPRVDFDTNFRKYLDQKENYDVETTATFGVPYPIREKVGLPSSLHCKSLTDKFTELRFDFYQNFEKFSYLVKQNEDQLVCLLKGNSSFILLDEEAYQKVKSTKSGAPKEDYTSVEYSISSLETGDCLFVPSNQYYGVKTNDLWLLSISWHHFSEKIEKADCQSTSVRNKLSDFIYRNDINQKFLDLGVSSVANLRSFISLLSNDEEGLKKKEFTHQVIKKLLNLEKEDKCKGACKDTIAEIFKAININEDKLLSLEDLDYLGIERSEKIDELVGEKFTKLKSSLKKPINLPLGLDDIFSHIKQTAAKLEITQEVDKLLETVIDKFNDFKSNLDEEKKKMIENFDLGKFLNTLLNQLNKISNIDGLLDTLKGLNLAPVLAHANVKKVIKDLLKRFDTEKDTFLNTLNFNSTLGFLLSQENLKGWNLNDLFGESNMNRIVGLMATLIDVNSFVDRLITGVGLLNMFGQMNLESTLNSINSDMLLDQVSNIKNFANLNVGGAEGRRAERAKHKEKLNNKKPTKKEESIFEDAQPTSGSSNSGEQEIEEINAYDDDLVKPETVPTSKKDQNVVKEDL